MSATSPHVSNVYRFDHRWALGLIAAVYLLRFWPLLTGQVLLWGLPALQFMPWYQLSRAAWQLGELPLWNPLNGGGEPLLANYQSGVFYLFNMAYAIVGQPLAVSWMTVAHVVFAALGMGMWATLLPGSNRLSQTIAALTYSLSAVLMQRLDNPAMLAVAAWTPWLLWAVHTTVTKPNLRHASRSAIVVGVLLLGGHAQWGFYALLTAALLAGWLAWQQPRGWVGLVFCAGGVAVGVLLAGIQLAPTYELLAQSARQGGLSYEAVVNFSLSPLGLLLFLSPHIYGIPGEGTYRASGALFELVAYVGLLPLLLGLHSLRFWRAQPGDDDPGRRWLLPLTALALVTVILAMGQHTPVFPLLFRHVPTFALFQAPSRWLFVTTLALCAIVAIVLPHWQPRAYWMRLSLAGAAVIVASGGLALLSDTEIIRVLGTALLPIGLTWAALAALGLWRRASDHPHYNRWALLLLAVVAADLFWATHAIRPTFDASFYSQRVAAQVGRSFWTEPLLETWQYDTYVPFDDYRLTQATIADLRRSELPNLNVFDDTSVYNSSNPLRPALSRRYETLLNEHPLPRLFTAAAITRTPPGAPVETVTGPVAQLGRAWVVSRAVWVDNTADAEAVMLGDDWQPARNVVLVGEGEPSVNIQPNVAAIAFVRETPTRVFIQVQSDAPGWLVLADTWYPGWEATLNGQPAPIYQANGAFRAVEIPVGDSLVIFQYEPLSFVVGVAMSLAGVLALFAVAFYLRVRQN